MAEANLGRWRAGLSHGEDVHNGRILGAQGKAGETTEVESNPVVLCNGPMGTENVQNRLRGNQNGG